MEPFLISEKRLAELAATRQGRVSLAGFNFQAAYAIARLASMMVRCPVLDLPDFPTRLRYDWGEDLDECCDGGLTIFTQCKRVASIGQAAGLSSVLQSFAAKWLAVPEQQRTQVHFRLVCTDTRFRLKGHLADIAPDSKAETEKSFVAELGTKPGPKSDRAIWQGDADKAGHAQLFASLWARTDVLFIDPSVIAGHPAGPLLPAEREALVLLLENSQLEPNRQTEALGRLRRIVHDNLITFDPTSDIVVDHSTQKPRVRDRADVVHALAVYRPASDGPLPFEVVDRTFLSQQRQAPRRQFVARQPDWADVVHGADETIKFVERSVTSDIRAKIVTELIEPIERATDHKLHMLFIVGAPGSGKTTLVRRIAAILVEEGRVVVADAGLDVPEPAGSPEEYVIALEKLAAAGRPVIFLLDDPLYGNSPWIPVLKKLNKPGLRVAVLSPCPQIHFDRYHGNIPFGVKHHAIGPPTEGERQEMRRLYGRTTDALLSTDEFLLIAMEAAAGIPFDEIMQRLWVTLNDGNPIVENDAQPWEQLVWTLRAFMIVCFFHRAYVPCPEPILRAALIIGAAQGTAGGITVALSRLRSSDGWMIIRFTNAEHERWAFRGTQVTAAHQRIAQRAWELRPMKWWDIGDKIIEASLVAPLAIRLVGQLAARLCSSDEESDKTFAERLVEAWFVRSSVEEIETRKFCELPAALHVNGQRGIACRLAPVLRARAKSPRDGWLAALQLFYLSGDSLATQSFPDFLDLFSIISLADFSIASTRATQFFGRLPSICKPAYTARILASFDGEFEWKPDSSLITWLLQHVPPNAILERSDAIEIWLKSNSDDTSVRTGYLGLLSKLGLDKAQLDRVIADTEAWLKAHLDDSHVRTAYLGFLESKWECRDKLQLVMREVEAWLKNHPQDTYTRTRYETLLQSAPSLSRPRPWQKELELEDLGLTWPGK
jgi:energy-coupling factor transporter ATP-binding protein EcfA2